jgi:phage-related holin
MNSMNEFLGITKGVFIGIADLFSMKIVPTILVPIYGVLFGFDTAKILQALLILVVMDFITGIVSAHAAGEVIKSRSAVRSAFKIAVYGLLVSAGHLTEQITPASTYIEEAVTTFLALTELISIIENVGKMGFAIPKKLLNQLHKFRDEGDTIAVKNTANIESSPESHLTKTNGL